MEKKFSNDSRDRQTLIKNVYFQLLMLKVDLHVIEIKMHKFSPT